MKKIQGIYKIRNCINGKIYVDQSIDIKNRFKQHKYICKKNKYNHPLYNAFKKYGIDNFEFIIVEIVDDIFLLDLREQYWLNHYQSCDRDYGYNIALGAKGVIHTEETKQKIANSHKGSKYSEEAKLNMAVAQKGKIRTEEHKNNISLSNKGHKVSDKVIEIVGNRFRGKQLSKEHREKMSESAKKRSADPEWRKNHSEKMKLNYKNKSQESKILILPKGDIVDINLLSKEAVNE